METKRREAERDIAGFKEERLKQSLVAENEKYRVSIICITSNHMQWNGIERTASSLLFNLDWNSFVCILFFKAMLFNGPLKAEICSEAEEVGSDLRSSQSQYGRAEWSGLGSRPHHFELWAFSSLINPSVWFPVRCSWLFVTSGKQLWMLTMNFYRSFSYELSVPNWDPCVTLIVWTSYACTHINWCSQVAAFKMYTYINPTLRWFCAGCV